jgi:hypothetical protein
MLWTIAGFAGAAVVGAGLWGWIASDVEQARYSVVEATGAIEIRDYAPMIAAETAVTGEREKAIEQGFRLIAGYIFGGNTARAKVAMTAPVTQQPGEAIAMTAPVTQEGDGQRWTVRFVMPANYTMETLPRPNNPAVRLREIPGRRVAVIRFSGTAGDRSIEEHKAQLDAFLASRKLGAVSSPTYAFYNPPWTLPFMRRNEIMAEIAMTSSPPNP